MREGRDHFRIDWFRVLADLSASGWRTQRIADRIQVARSTLMGWKQGAEPKHADGERLVTLWVMVTGGDRDGVPLAPYWPGHRCER